MKKSILSVFALAFIMLASTSVNAQKFAGMDKSPLDVSYYRTSRNAAPIAKVVYSRPQLKGRSLSKLAPNGKVWRTGANESAEITFYQDVKLGGESVKAGTYSLFTIPGETQWTVILNSDLHTWGAYGYKEANDVARFKVDTKTSGDSLEAFSIAFDGDGMHMGWDKTRVTVPMGM